MDGDLIQGALQSLLQNRERMSQRQQQAQQQHIQTMQTPLPQTSPIQSMVSDYLQKYAQNPGMAWSAMASAAGGANERSRKIEEDFLLRQQAADAQEAKYAGEALKEEDLFGGRMMGGRGLAGRQPSPEQLRVVHNNLRNEAAQVAKDYNFNTPQEREQWITEYTNRGITNYLENFATQPLGPRGAKPEADEPQITQPQVTQPQVTQAPDRAQTAARNIGLIQTELQRPENQSGERFTILQEELAREKTLLDQAPTQTPTATKPGGKAAEQPSAATTMPATTSNATAASGVQPTKRNIPFEEASKQGAKEMASAYVKDYETVQQEATAAAQQKAAFDALQKIKPNTGLFANTEQVVGSLFSALGQDPNSPAIQNAMKTRSAEQILNQLTNASLKAEKGVQTKTDEVRIYKEFPKTSDFQKVWDFSVKLGQERAQRKLDQRDYFESVAAQNNGTPIGARRKWDQEMQGDPITQYLGGKLIFRSDFIKAYNNKYPDLGTEGAVAKWREMEKEYQARGGRK